MQGIYRVSGAKQRIDRLSQAFENGPDLVDLTNIPPNVIADVLKNYMRQLPEPLLTFRYFLIAIECCYICTVYTRGALRMEN